MLRNLGASVAKNVTVCFDPPPPDDLDELPADNMLKWIYERYATSITTWAAGWTLSNVIRAGHEALAPITVTTQYRDPYYLHPDHILKETESSPSKTDDPVKLEQQKISALQALVRTVRSS